MNEIKKKFKSAPYLEGRIFGSWLVISKAQSKHGKSHWNCICTCGVNKIVCGQSLLNGSSTRCLSCYTDRQGNFKHGFCCGEKIPEYHIWRSIKERCTNPRNKYYKNYGGRGITICDQWRKDFNEFITYVGKKPFENATLDRINNNEGYFPGNVRWTTPKIQAQNTRRQIYGFCIEEWCRNENKCRHSVGRLLRKGFSLDYIKNKVSLPYVSYPKNLDKN